MSELRVRYSGRVVGENRRLNYSRKTGRAHLNPAYRIFKRSLFLEVRRSMGTRPPWPYPFKGQVELEIRGKLHPKADVDNCIKPVQDALQEAGAILNDNQIRKTSSERIGNSRGGEASLLALVLREV
jgi:Holliday junction resolvase RusA-like endonuclease